MASTIVGSPIVSSRNFLPLCMVSCMKSIAQSSLGRVTFGRQFDPYLSGSLFTLTDPQRKTFFSVYPLRALMIDNEPFALEKYVQPPATKAFF